MLVSTHNLGSVPDFCDRTVFVKGTVIAYGRTEDTFNEENLEKAFGGVLRHFILGGRDLHDDEDVRHVRVISDDERPYVTYGNGTRKTAGQKPTEAADAPDAS
jgi:manganese/iron transport system ATP-binding protein